jgi:AraC family transcriptional regulator of adaptative response/methylated-DNA-[protein]-cysteine methyltransferase
MNASDPAFLCLSPAAFRQRHAGVPIRYGLISSPFGALLLALTPEGVCRAEFLEEGEAPQARWEVWRARWPWSVWAPLSADECAALEARFLARDLPVVVEGTPFRGLIWRALRQTEAGQTLSYGMLAERLGRPQLARAVGQALGANPVAWLIPCHRVLDARGSLRGFRWGLARKRAMLEREEKSA